MSLDPILSEVKPAATDNVVVYSVPPGEHVTGTVFCLNQDDAPDFVDVALVSNGNVLSSNSYVCYETIAYHGQSIYLQEIYLSSQDNIVVRSANGSTSFTFTGYKL
jgi:hypothetical protein